MWSKDPLLYLNNKLGNCNILELFIYFCTEKIELQSCLKYKLIPQMERGKR
jgi:hypothetical protein